MVLRSGLVGRVTFRSSAPCGGRAPRHAIEVIQIGDQLANQWPAQRATGSLVFGFRQVRRKAADEIQHFWLPARGLDMGPVRRSPCGQSHNAGAVNNSSDVQWIEWSEWRFANYAFAGGAGVHSRWRPLSVVLTLWLSVTAALEPAWRPARSRSTRTRHGNARPRTRPSGAPRRSIVPSAPTPPKHCVQYATVRPCTDGPSAPYVILRQRVPTPASIGAAFKHPPKALRRFG